MAAQALTTTLERLRTTGIVNLIGLTLLALVGIWLVVNAAGPTEFINVA